MGNPKPDPLAPAKDGAVRTVSQWPSRLGQAAVFLTALGAMVLFGVVNPSAAMLGEVLTFCLAVFVLLRLPAIAKLKALGVEVETREALSKIIEQQAAENQAASKDAPASTPAHAPPAALPTNAPAPAVAALPQSTESSVRFDAIEAAPTAKPAAAPPATQRDERWCRSGHVYWLGHNTMFAAFALAQNNVSAALLEWNNAIGHAMRLPLPKQFVTRLRYIQQRFDLLDTGQRVAAIQSLLTLAGEIGRFIASEDPGFEDFARFVHPLAAGANVA